MPIYEYKCKICGKKFEKLVLNGIEAIQCSECGGSEVIKLFSGFSFKGERHSSPNSSGGCSSCSGKSCSSCH